MGIAERKNRQRQALRERILDAARHIVMREGFAALSMRKIADAIEYSPATLYLHFASRDEIARALCEEGYAQLLETFEPFARVADPAERLKAIGRAYVAFGVEHPQTYRLIFMEDPSYTGAALAGVPGASRGEKGSGKRQGTTAIEAGTGNREAGDEANDQAGRDAGNEADAAAPSVAAAVGATANPIIDSTVGTASGDSSGSPGRSAAEAGDDAGAAALQLMIEALDELRAAGRLSASIASMDSSVWAEALWASLHGIVALNLTCPVFPSAPLDTVVGVTLDAWLGTPRAARPRRAAGTSGAAGAAGAAGTAPTAATRSKKSPAKQKQPAAPGEPTTGLPRTRRKSTGP